MRKLLRLIGLLAISIPAAAANGGAVPGNAEIDGMFAACMQKDAERAPVYARMLKPPFSCDVNMSKLPRVEPNTKQYNERYEAVLKSMLVEGKGTGSCAYLVMYCLEAVPAVSRKDKETIMLALDDKTGKLASALPAVPGGASAKVTGDGIVPEDIESLLAHANENTRLSGLLATYKKKTRLPDQIVDRILQDKSKAVRLSVLNYPYLNEGQIDSIIRTKDLDMIWELTGNQLDKMNAAQISSVAESRNKPIQRRLAQHGTLAPEHIRLLSQSDDPETQFWLAQRFGVGSVTKAMKGIIDSGSAHKTNTIDTIVWTLKPVPASIVDLLLAHPDAAIRTHLTMNGKFDPTPAQIQQILSDPVHDVRIGLLRRKDVTIPADLLSLGNSHPDKGLAFWYSGHKDFVPTPTEVEAGLTNKDVVRRRSYASMGKFKPSDAQVERGLLDEDDGVRSAFLQRKDVTLTDLHLDRCTSDVSFSVRYVCVRLPGYQLTRYRFERILFDKNPNILNAFTGNHPGKKTDLRDLIGAVLRNGSPEVQIALANNQGVKLDAAQAKIGMDSSIPEVRLAFERRRP